MTLNRIITVFVVIFIIFIGMVFYQFSRKPEKRTVTNTSATNPTTPQVTINRITFKVTAAKTPVDQQIGLSNKNSLPQDQGLLFTFDKPDYKSFWTKGMKFPIDIIFIRENKIVQIAQNAPPIPENQIAPIYTSEVPVDKILEINAGLTNKYKFKIGDTVSFQQ